MDCSQTRPAGMPAGPRPIVQVPAGDRPFGMAVSALPGIGAVRARRLRAHYGSYEQAWRAGSGSLQASGIVPCAQIPSIVDARKNTNPHDLSSLLSRHGVLALFEGDPSYPPLLASLHDAPVVVYIRGGFAAGDDCPVALVGTRRMSAYGRFVASRLARDLGAAGYTVVSGLARGIDAVAHQAALDSGGRTVAVLAGGLDCIYPPEHQDLAERVTARGTLVSEYPPGTPTVSGNFPARNRLISGMAVATVVVEAGLRSGALLTAGFALEQGREVFAVPGRIGDPGSAGVHALLREGAGLVESAADIIAGLPDWARLQAVQPAGPDALRPGQVDDARQGPPGDGAGPAIHDVQRRILAMVARGPCREEQLLEAGGAEPGLVRATLVRLEMQGFVQRLPGAIFIGGKQGLVARPPEVAEWNGRS